MAPLLPEQERTQPPIELSSLERQLPQTLLKLPEKDPGNITGHTEQGLTPWRRGASPAPQGYPHWPYLRGMVGDTLKDPTHGGRVQREIGQQLHTLGHQLVLDRVPMNLQETKRTSERRGVTSHTPGWLGSAWMDSMETACFLSVFKNKMHSEFPTPPS